MTLDESERMYFDCFIAKVEEWGGACGGPGVSEELTEGVMSQP